MAEIKWAPKKLKIEFIANDDASIHAGLPIIEAMARRFKLWEKIRNVRVLDPRSDRTRGYSPEVIIGQLIYALCEGGGCLSDSESLNDDPFVCELFGVGKFADQSQVGEWLRAQSEVGIAALGQLVREFVAWVKKHADPARMTLAGRTELFFDDTQIEVSSDKFQGAAMNYNGDIALSWQCLWVGPLLAESDLGPGGDVSAKLPAMLDAARPLWSAEPAHFWADSASSAGIYLNKLEAEGIDYTISYNKWTGPLERAAAALPQSAWSEPSTDPKNPRPHERHAWVKHQPEGCQRAQLFAVTRWRRAGEMIDSYGFIACNDGHPSPKAIVERHRLKGEKERLFSEVLSGLDLHRPPCHSLSANRAYYQIAALAYNLMIAVRLLDLGDAQQGWRLRTMMKKLIFMPGRLARRARQTILKIQVPGTWLNWWQRWQQRAWAPEAQESANASIPTG